MVQYISCVLYGNLQIIHIHVATNPIALHMYPVIVFKLHLHPKLDCKALKRISEGGSMNGHDHWITFVRDEKEGETFAFHPQISS